MPRPTSFLGVFLWTLAVWAITFVLYVVTIIVAVIASDAGRARLSTVQNVVIALTVIQFVIACLAIAFVFLITRNYFQTTMRFLWAGLFALPQLATFAMVAFAMLLMFNQ